MATFDYCATRTDPSGSNKVAAEAVAIGRSPGSERVLSVSAVTIRLKTEKELQALLREAESELDAATKRSELNLAARKLMQAKRALKLIQPQVHAQA